MEKNNIFNFATKELSQDAFICWLLNWINYKQENENLYKVAYKFFKLIFKKADLPVKKFKIKKILQQYKKIDIFIELENGYYIIIEDKMYTNEHIAGKTKTPQLLAYKNSIMKNIDENKIITVFYKMYDFNKNFTTSKVSIDREEMLEILKPNINNDIYNDYKNYLKSIQTNVENIEKIPVKKWIRNKELINYFFQKNYNTIFKKDSRIGYTQGSIYIDWNYIYRNNFQDFFGTNMCFDFIHLALDLNYEKTYIYVKASVKENEKITNYNKDERLKIQDKLRELFKQNGIDDNCLINHTVKDASKSFRLLTIDISKYFNKQNSEILYDDLKEIIEKVSNIVNTFFIIGEK